MFLKSLTIQGFKSFASRVTVELPKGIAAVVGPNGSGKSNIADALRWVLGEQSLRLLRGTRLEDVIFAGSDAKRAVGMAEVSITFDNTSGRIPVEYTEVTATRRVYRSGESEFLINRSPCRLKDIQELFMDTGIGRGSLSIIGQGEVDAILSAKPEDRRAFLEEAAGITRYQARKEEAVRRLARAHDDLLRVQDIIAEVERQLGPLKIQAEKAEEYDRLSGRLVEIEVALLLQERGRAEERFSRTSQELAAALGERDGLRGSLQSLEAKSGELAQRIEGLDKELDDCRSLEERARASEAEERHKAAVAKERIARYEAEGAERARRIAADRERIADIERALSEERKALQSALEAAEGKDASLRDAERALAELRAGLGTSGEKARVARERASALSEQIAALESRIEAFGRESEGIGEQRAELLARRDRLAGEFEAAAARAAEKEKALRDAEAAHEGLKSEIEEAERELRGLAAARKALEEEFAAKRRAAQDLAARRKALAEMEEAREGYQRGVRAVLQAHAERRWGLLGAVAELIEVPERLEAAIEVALGPAQQFIVAEGDRGAKLAIEFLKERKLGRATFLPLDSLKADGLREEARARIERFGGVIGVASDLVKAPKACEPAVRYLLGRVVVTETLDAALALAKAGSGAARIVSVDGDVVIPGGAITGGSRAPRSEGLLGRGRQLAALAAELQKAEAEAQGAGERIARLMADEIRMKERAAELEKERRKLEIERLTLERDLGEARAAVARIEAESSECRAALERLDRREAALKSEVEEASSAIAAMFEEREALKEAAERFELGMAEERGKEEALRTEAERLRVALAELRQGAEQRRRELNRLEGERAAAVRAIAEEEEQAARALAGRKAAEEEIGRALAAAEAFGKELAELAARAERLAYEKSLLRKESQELTSQAAAARAELEAVHERATRLSVECERLEAELARITEQLAERGWTAEMGFERGEAGEEAAMRAEARSLRKRIAELGPINPNSVEEYREVRERYEFLRAQKDDLEEAKADLTEVIARIDKESVKKIQSVYEELRAAFNETFRRLLGGGSASLEFSDPDRPLESGLEIFVQPPGKKLQNLMALSGGEKALAAIALLFGILKVRPSPFCVLDEIDAALDEHNLVRFRSLLEEFSKETQFLIITHRQPTMEAADALYGVTMEESGVSALVSLKLDDAKSA